MIGINIYLGLVALFLLCCYALYGWFSYYASTDPLPLKDLWDITRKAFKQAIESSSQEYQERMASNSGSQPSSPNPTNVSPASNSEAEGKS